MKEASTDFGRVAKISDDKSLAIIEREDDGKLYYLTIVADDIGDELMEKLIEGALVHFSPDEIEEVPRAQLIYVFSEEEEGTTKA
jgi:hypothetical protein